MTCALRLQRPRLGYSEGVTTQMRREIDYANAVIGVHYPVPLADTLSGGGTCCQGASVVRWIPNELLCTEEVHTCVHGTEDEFVCQVAAAINRAKAIIDQNADPAVVLIERIIATADAQREWEG